MCVAAHTTQLHSAAAAAAVPAAADHWTLQVIAFASHPAALVMAAACSEQGQGGLKTLGSFNSRASQQDLVAALNARIARETAELAELRAKVARERER